MINLLLLFFPEGGEYAPGTPTEAFDFQKPSILGWLGFIGFTSINAQEIEPTLAPPEVVESILKENCTKASNIAKSF